MAMTLDTAIKFTAKLEGQGLDQLKRGLQGMAQQANRTSKDLDQLYNANKKLAQAAGGSLNSLQRQITVMTNLRNEAQIGSRQFKFYTAELDKLQKQQAKLNGATRGGGGIMALGGSLGGLAAAAGGALAVKYIADVGLEAESAQVRLRALADEFGEYNQAQAATARIAQTLRISNTEAQNSFASLYASLRPTGITIAELEKAFVGFSAAARNSGATAQETSAALIQLKQGLASGVLQGEELRSIREQAPLAAQAIAKEMGVSIGELKKLASEGQVTTDVVLRALGRLQDSQLGKLNAQFQTGRQALSDLQIELRKTGEGIAKAFGPTAIALLRAFTATLQRVSDALGLTEGAAERQQDRIRATFQAQREARERFGIGGVFRYGFQIDRFQNQRRDELFNQFQAERRDRAMGAISDNPTADQQAARDAAAAERESARQRAKQEALDKELKIREDAEEKLADAAQRNAEQLADFRAETIKRVAELERDLGDQRLQIERSIAEARRRIAEQEQDQALEAERQRLAAAGLSTEGIDAARELGEISRRYSEQRIQNEQNATDRQVQLQRQLEQFKTSVADGIGKIQEGYARSVSNILQDAGEKLAQKMQQGAQAAASTLTGAPGGIIARTGNTGQSTGPHLDARWADGRRITAADADRYLRVNGRAPSSFGVTSPYGPRNMFGRNFHAGMDFGTPSGSGISLQNGAKVLRDLGFTGAGGYAVEIDTPQGRMRLLHLQGGSVSRAAASPSSFNSAGLMGGLDRAGQQLGGAIGTERSVRDQQAFNDLFGAYQAKFGAYKQDLDGVTRSSKQQLEDQQRIYQLMADGLSPELARQRVDAENTAKAESERLQALEAQLDKELQRTDLTERQRLQLKDLRAEVIARQMNEEGITANLLQQQQALEALQQSYERTRQLADGIANSIGSGLTGAFDLVLNGTENWGDSLREIAAGVLKDIAQQLFQIYVVNSLISGIKSLFPVPGGTIPVAAVAANGMVAGNGIQPFAMGGIVNSPTLFKFAAGGTLRNGLMGEAGPEAIIPLKRGRDGKLGVAGGGATTVNVSVDAKGTSVQGDPGQGAALGRAIAGAVQAELIKQKRPGGLLAA